LGKVSVFNLFEYLSGKVQTNMVGDRKTEAEASTPEAEASTPEAEASTPEVEASTPEPEAGTNKTDAKDPLAEDLGAPEKDRDAVNPDHGMTCNFACPADCDCADCRIENKRAILRGGLITWLHDWNSFTLLELCKALKIVILRKSMISSSELIERRNLEYSSTFVEWRELVSWELVFQKFDGLNEYITKKLLQEIHTAKGALIAAAVEGWILTPHPLEMQIKLIFEEGFEPSPGSFAVDGVRMIF
jgi:hypothetical protein